MHPEARAGLSRMIDRSAIGRHLPWEVLDLGGQDINGSIRDLLPHSKWSGVDIEDGPAVDLVHDCTKPWPDDFPRFDLVVCTEVLEHVQDWPALLKTCGQALKPDGPGLLYITAASDGRRAHGATGAMWPAPGEWYCNVPPSPLIDVLEDLFEEAEAEYNPNPGDVYAWASHPRRRA